MALLVLVPTERHAEEEAARGHRALTLRRAVARVADVASPAHSPSTPEVTRLSVARMLDEPRLAGAVDQALGDLIRAGTDAATLRTIGGRRACWLADLLDAKDALLESAGLRDERRDGWLAATLLGKNDEQPLGRVQSVEVRGLCRWDAGILAFLEALHQHARSSGGEGLSLELPETPWFAERAPLESLAARLERRWAELPDAPTLCFAKGRGARTHARVIAAEHSPSEARAIGRLVLDALSAGTPIDRVAVAVVRPDEGFLDPLRGCLRDARIPVSESRGQSALAAPQAHAALELLRLARGPVTRDGLLEVLRAPALRPLRWLAGKPSSHLEQLVVALRQATVRVDRSGEDLLTAVKLSASGTEAVELCERVLRDVRHLGLDAKRPEQRDRALALLGDLGLLDAPAATIREALEATDGLLLGALGNDARGTSALTAAVERAARASVALGLGEEVTSFSRFLEEVEAALGSESSSRGAGRAGALRIGRPEELAGLNLDLVIVARASSAHLDRARPNELLGEELVLKLPPGRRPTSASEGRAFTELSLASLLTHSERAIVTFARHDERGSTDGPCRFVRALAVERYENEPASALHPAARRVTNLPVPGAAARRNARIELSRTAYFMDPALPAGEHTGRAPNAGRVIDGTTPETAVSVTALERYLTCPFLGFAVSVLRAVRGEELDEGVNALERGRIVHGALEQALRAIENEQSTRSPDELEQLALTAASLHLESLGGSLLRRAGLAAMLGDVRALVRWSLEQGDGLFFRDAERAFGPGEDWPALELDGSFFRGRIDRIDVSTDGRRARVIDYKTGMPPKREDLGQRLLQPWLYARQVERELGAVDVSSGYLSLNRRDPKLTLVCKGAASEQDRLQAEARARHALRDLRAGLVDPRPCDPKACGQCDARDLCRRPLSAPGTETEGSSP
jgi:RecB family exonuclease